MYKEKPSADSSQSSATQEEAKTEEAPKTEEAVEGEVVEDPSASSGQGKKEE